MNALIAEAIARCLYLVGFGTFIWLVCGGIKKVFVGVAVLEKARKIVITRTKTIIEDEDWEEKRK